MRLRSLCVLALTLIVALPASAGYDYSGYNPQIIHKAYGLTDTALYVGREGLFSSLWGGLTDDDVVAPDFDFDLPDGTGVRYARLSIGWWGGTADYTTSLDLTINGHTLDPLIFGGTGDANAVHDPNGVSVYGAGAGMWLTCFDVTGNVQLGQTNTVQLDIEAPPGVDPLDWRFDGRCYHWQLVMAYDTPTDYTLSYQIAEGYGSLREYVPELNHRMVGFSPVALTEPYEADLWLAYTHGTQDQLDWAEFNGLRLDGTDDLADGSEQSIFFDPTAHPHKSYFDFQLFDVADHLNDATNELHIYTPAYSGESILNIASAILATREHIEGEDIIPEPATIALLGLALLGLARRRRTRSRSSRQR